MNKKKIRIISIVLTVCILSGVVYKFFLPENTLATSGKNEAISGDVAKSTYKSNPNAARGSEENPFIVLEVVPTLDQAQFGYFIPGCEPVDMNKLAINYDTTKDLLNLMSGTFSASEEWIYECYENIPASTPYYVYAGDGTDTDAQERYSSKSFEKGYWSADSIDQTTYNVWWQDKYNSNCSQEGYFEKVEAGTGDFELVETRDYNAFNRSDIYVSGTYDTYYAFSYKEGGDYVWHKDDNKPDNFTPDDDLSIVWMTRNDLFKCHTVQITNNDLFVQQVLGEDSANFITKVITITPEQLAGNLSLIDEADLIFFHTADNTTATMQLWNYASDNTNATHTLEGGNPEGFANHDLSNDTVYRIMERMAGSNPAALIYEMTTMAAGGGDKNIYKLMLMTMQYKPNDFVNTYGFLDKIRNDSAGKNTLYYGSAYNWDINTLTIGPDGTNLIDKMRDYWVSTENHNVLDKIFTYNGNNSMFQELFSDANISVKHYENTTTGFGSAMQDMYDYYGTDETYTHTVVDALRFILNGSVSSLSKIRVLEIQPCDEFVYGNDSYRTEAGGDWKTYYEGLFKGYSPTTDKESWVEDESLIEVTTMPVWEFNGSTGRYDYTAMDEETGNPLLLTTASSDDLLAKYDLIIIGSNQTASNGLNGYNDTNLGHLIYTAVGDLVQYYSGGSSTYDFTSGNSEGTKREKTARQVEDDGIRYTANDITLKKMLELEDFLKAGKPIVVDDQLFASGDAKVDKDPDTTKVDSNAKIYDLLTWDDSSEKNGDANLLVYGMYASSKIKSMITQSQCDLVFYDDENRYPLEYSYTETEAKKDGITVQGAISNEYYQSKDENGKAILTYHFYIAGTSGEQYQAYLHIDSDGDGVYSGSLKEHSEVDNMSAATGKSYSYDTSEKALSMSIYKAENGKRTYIGTSTNCTLEPYQEYYATYELPEDKLGIVPWKLEVNAVSNVYQRSSAINYTAFAQVEEPAQVNVLQMCLPTNLDYSSTGSYGYPSDNIYGNGESTEVTYYTNKVIDLGSYRNSGGVTYYNVARHYYNPDYDYTASNSTSISVKNNGGGTVKKFELYLEPVKEFNINIQFMRIREWSELFSDGAVDETGRKLTKQERTDNWISFLSQYDMIILGFMDGNAFTSDDVFVEGYKDFAAQGKGIILSHDTVGSTNFLYEPTGNRWYSSYLLGGKYIPWLRTFSGQRASYYYYDSTEGVYKKSYTEQYTHGQKINDMDTLEAKIRTLTDVRRQRQYYEFTEAIDSDVVDEEFYGTYSMEIIDNSDQLYARRVNSNYKSDRVTKTSYIDTWPNPAYTTNIRLMNNGQITSYPYQLDEYLQVLQTHAQNYRLDMEFLEEGDVNVWYCLTDTQNPSVKDKSSFSRVNLYSGRPLDGQNSFFIYNKGNITYTGSGHVGSSSVMPDDEVKLFVNTMISAYRAPDASPYATIDNADSVASDGTSVLYVDSDGSESSSDAIIDSRVVTVNGKQMIRVEFSIQEGSGNTTYSGKSYYLAVGQEDGIALDVYEADGETPLSTDSDGQYKVKTIDDGVSYVMYVPYSEVVSDGSIDFSLTVYATYTKGGRKVETSKKVTNGTVTLLPLFDLT